MPTYRTNGAWGSGIGVNLTPAQVDENFYELRSDLDDVIANPPTANSIETITASGFTWTVQLTDGTILDPLPVPVVYTVWRGDWTPLTLYSEADLFRVEDQGIFAVLQDHTSAATFDPDAVAGSPPALLYTQLIGVSSLPVDTMLDELGDVTITAAADDDFIAWDAGSSQWTNRTSAAVASLLSSLTNLDDLADVIAPSPLAGQVLRYIGGSPDALWQPDTLILDDLSDVAASAPTDGQVLTYQAGSPTGWIAATPAAIPTTLDALTDVVVPTPSDGDLLQFDGANWINEAGSAISDLTSATAPFTGLGYMEVSEPSGSPAIYTSKKILINDLFNTRTLSGTTTLDGFTAGSILIAGTSGVLSQNNASLFWDDSNKRARINGNSAALPAALTGTQMHVGGADAAAARVLVDAFANNAQIVFRRANTTAASPSALTLGSVIGGFTAFGYGATGYSSAGRAQLQLLAAENWTDTAQGTYGQFAATSVGTTTSVTALLFNGLGVGAKTLQPPASNLEIGGAAGTARIWNAYSDAANNEFAYLGDWGISANVATFGPDKAGTGSYRPGRWVSGGLEIWRSRTNGDFQIGTGTAIATNATGGFLKITTCAGTPTGAPANAATGSAEVIYDSTGKKLWIYDNATTSWKGVVVA